MENLIFEYETACDFCGRHVLTSKTQYGTTHYNKFICNKCAAHINETEHCFIGVVTFKDWEYGNEPH